MQLFFAGDGKCNAIDVTVFFCLLRMRGVPFAFERVTLFWLLSIRIPRWPPGCCRLGHCISFCSYSYAAAASTKAAVKGAKILLILL